MFNVEIIIKGYTLTENGRLLDVQNVSALLLH